MITRKFLGRKRDSGNPGMLRPIGLAILFIMTAVVGPGAVRAEPFTAGPLIQASGPSLFAGCTADNVAGQPGTNYPDSEIEPSVAVNPTNPNNIVAVWQQDRWSTAGARGIVAGVSQDGGTSWASVVIPGLSLCSGGTLQRVTNPWLSFAPNGVLYLASLPFDVAGPGFSGQILVSKSVNGGQSWSNPTIVEDLRSSYYILVTDREAITADPINPNFVYIVWTRLLVPPDFNFSKILGPTVFARTTDGGQTWERPRVIYSPGPGKVAEANQLLVLPDGTLVSFFSASPLYSETDPNIKEADLSLVRSKDKGKTWSGPIRAARMQTRGVTDPDNNALLRGGHVVPLFNVAVDPSNGSLYAVWQDARFTGVDSIAFTRSTDGGLTWSAPIKINQTPTNIALANQQAWIPGVGVAADGTIAVTHYDFRNNIISSQGALMDYWIVHCHPDTRPGAADCTESADWGDEVRLTNASFDIEKAPLNDDPFFGSGYFLGDFVPLTSVGNAFVPTFPQPHGTDAASIFFRRVEP